MKTVDSCLERSAYERMGNWAVIGRKVLIAFGWLNVLSVAASAISSVHYYVMTLVSMVETIPTWPVICWAIGFVLTFVVAVAVLKSILMRLSFRCIISFFVLELLLFGVTKYFLAYPLIEVIGKMS